MPEQQSLAPIAGKLPFLLLLKYSIGNVTLTAIYGFLGTFFLKFYTDFISIDPAWVGWAVLIRSIIDAIVDPFIGHCSDRTRSRYGRRRPYFLVGAIPGAILFLLLLTPPQWSDFGIFCYLTVISSLMAGFLSLMGITHLALGFELTTNYDERTKIFGLKNLIENLTTLMATLCVPVFLNLENTRHFDHTITRIECYYLAAAMLATAAIVGAWIAFAGTSESPVVENQQPDSFVAGVRDLFCSLAFRVLLWVFVCMAVVDRVIAAEFMIVLEQLHGLHEEDSVFVLTSLFLGAILSVWAWVWMAQRFGKNLALNIAIVMTPIACLLFVICPWSSGPLAAVTFLMGVSGAGMVTVIGAMVPDVLEIDYLKTGRRREGLYVSIGNIVFQVATGLGTWIAGLTLHFAGYRGPQAISPDTPVVLRVTFILIPMGLSVCALVAFAWYPITKQSYQAMLQEAGSTQDRQ